MTLEQVTYQNSQPLGSGNQTFTFGNTQQQTNSKTIGTQDTHTFGTSVAIGVSGKVGVPLLAEAEVSVTTTVSYEYSHMSSTSTTDTTTITEQWSLSGTIAPQHAVFCKATAQTGSFNSAYTSTLQITLKGGQVFNTTQKGQFSSSGWSQAVANCQDIPLSQASTLPSHTK